MAYKNLNQYRCGDCGNGNYHLYKQKGNETDLFCECTECKTISVVSPSKPSLNIEFGEDATGRMTTY